jgi:hypothetical protein
MFCKRKNGKKKAVIIDGCTKPKGIEIKER